MERTFVMIKPDGVQRRLVGTIIARFERKGLKLVGLKLLRLTEEKAAQLYSIHRERPFFSELVRFVTSGPVVVMVWEGPGAVAIVRRIIGATDAASAEPGTVRGDFGLSVQMNLVHASDSPMSVARELPLLFSQDELVDYEMADAEWLGRSDE